MDHPEGAVARKQRLGALHQLQVGRPVNAEEDHIGAGRRRRPRLTGGIGRAVPPAAERRPRVREHGQRLVPVQHRGRPLAELTAELEIVHPGDDDDRSRLDAQPVEQAAARAERRGPFLCRAPEVERGLPLRPDHIQPAAMRRARR